MPTPRTWLPRTAEILEVLRTAKVQELDRSAIEKLFQLQRRSAFTLIGQVGAVKSGAQSAVRKKDLIAWVESIWMKEGQDVERRRQVSEHLDEQISEQKAIQQALREAGRPSVQFPIVQDVLASTIAALPAGIHLDIGRIVLEFDPTDAKMACQMLYYLGMAIANDYDVFERAVQYRCTDSHPDSCITEPF